MKRLMKFLEENSINWKHIVLTLLSGISAYIHLVLGLRIGLEPLGISFILATLGFAAGSILVILNYNRKIIYLLGIPFLISQIIAWYWLNGINIEMIPRALNIYDLVDKTAQIILLILLTHLLREER